MVDHRGSQSFSHDFILKHAEYTICNFSIFRLWYFVWLIVQVTWRLCKSFLLRKWICVLKSKVCFMQVPLQPQKFSNTRLAVAKIAHIVITLFQLLLWRFRYTSFKIFDLSDGFQWFLGSIWIFEYFGYLWKNSIADLKVIMVQPPFCISWILPHSIYPFLKYSSSQHLTAVGLNCVINYQIYWSQR